MLHTGSSHKWPEPEPGWYRTFHQQIKQVSCTRARISCLPSSMADSHLKVWEITAWETSAHSPPPQPPKWSELNITLQNVPTLILDTKVKAACGVTVLSCQLQWYHIILDRATEAHWPWLCCHLTHVGKQHGPIQQWQAEAHVQPQQTPSRPQCGKHQTDPTKLQKRSSQSRETLVCKVSHSASTMWVSLTWKCTLGHSWCWLQNAREMPAERIKLHM